MKRKRIYIFCPSNTQYPNPFLTHTDFGALLTGRTSRFLKREQIKSVYSVNNPQNIVATARFTFHKKNLYYSFYVSDRSTRPRMIQFIDATGHILEEHPLIQSSSGPVSLYQNTTGKICGVWRRVPRDYRKQLRDETISVVLLWGGSHQAELALAGRVSMFAALATEMFSTLLEPATASGHLMAGSGGTAIISTRTSSVEKTSSIHMTLVLNGLFPSNDTDVALNVRVETLDQKQVLHEVVRVPKPASDYNVFEFSAPITQPNLKLLTRGKLALIVEARNQTALRIQGAISSRVACEHFQTLLGPPNGESKTKSSGLAWIYLNRDGALVYNIYTDALDANDNTMLTLVDDRVKRRTELEDLTPSLIGNTAVGAINAVGPRLLEALYLDNLAINFATADVDSVIRGRLVTRQVADSRDSTEPILLKRIDASTPAHMIGMAWLSVDNECSLHYEITLNDHFNHQHPYQLYLEEIPIEAPGAPVSRRLLEEFSGHYLEGSFLDFSPYDLVKLETSVVYLEVRTNDTVMLRGKLRSTKIPGQCASYTDNDVPSVGSPMEHNDNNQVVASGGNHETHCFDSRRFHKEGDQWKSELEPCTMCSCQHGVIKCEPMKCPRLMCRADEQQVQGTAECCASCVSTAPTNATSQSANKGCTMADQFHPAGSSWHPYLPPNGFDTCTTCTCNATTLLVEFRREQCPPLNCLAKLAYRPDKKACCKVCPDVSASIWRHRHKLKITYINCVLFPLRRSNTDSLPRRPIAICCRTRRARSAAPSSPPTRLCATAAARSPRRYTRTARSGIRCCRPANRNASRVVAR